MQDRNAWRLLAEAWQDVQRARADKLADDPERRLRLEKIDQGLAENKLLIGRLRAKRAAALRALRALSRKLGIKAARPLPRCSRDRPFPDTEGSCGIRHFTGEAGSCVECGAGPVGWRKGSEPGPVCDDCVIQLDRRLAAIPVLANYMREAGGLELLLKDEEVALSSLILATATMYQTKYFEGMPIRRIDPKAGLAPLLARLRASYREAEDGEEEEPVSH